MKKMSKRFLSAVLALVMVLTIFSGVAISAGALGETVTVYFENVKGWEPVNCYFWSDDNTAMTQWPGEKMKHEAAAFYSLEIPADTQYVIFNDEKYQTLDLKFPGAGYVYSSADGWSLYTGCIHVWNEGVVKREPDCTVKGYQTFTCTLCSDTYQEDIPPLGHDYENGVCVVCGSQEPATYTLYFRNTEGWDRVLFYYWADGFEPVSWPGIETVPVGDEVYLARVPYQASYVIFNSGDGSQTADLPIPGTGNYIYELGGGSWEKFTPGCVHEYQDGICIHCQEKEPGSDIPSEKYTVYMDLAKTAWDEVNVYWWADGEAVVEWPGEAMTHVGGSVYSARVPSYATGLLFNAGVDGWQTEDLELCDGYIYHLPTGEWEPHNGCTHEWGEAEVVVEPSCTEDGLSRYTCLNCDESFEEVAFAYGHNYEYYVCINCGKAVPETITIYLAAAEDWDQAYAYVWEIYDMPVEWPGYPMTKCEDGCWQVEIPGNCDNVVFNNGEGDQTGDLLIPGDGATYDWIGNVWRPAFIDPEQSITVYLDAGIRSLGTLYTCWQDGDGNEFGIPMTHEGGSVYSAQVPEDLEVLGFFDEENLSVGFGGLYFEDGDIYNCSTAEWYKHNGCGHEWTEDEVIVPVSCTTEGESLYVCPLCDLELQFIRESLGHDWVGDLCSRCGQDANEMFTVYYDMEFSDRENVFLYWWADGDNNGYPGELMTHEGGSIYSGQVPAWADGLLFGDEYYNTPDLTLPGNGYVYREAVDKWVLHNGCCHEWNDGVCDLCGEEKFDYVTVYFNHGLDDCTAMRAGYYCNEVMYTDMEHVGGRVFSARVPQNVVVWFECGCGPVGAVDDIPGDGYIYYPTEDRWEIYNGCGHEWDQGQLVTEWSCTDDEVTLYSCLHCDEIFEYRRAALEHDYVNFVCTRCGKEVPETMTLYFKTGEDFGQVYAYVWNNDGEMISWPGTEMNRLEEGLYSIELPGYYQNIVFNCGEDWQTEDLKIPGDGSVYDWDWDEWVELPGQPDPEVSVSGVIGSSDLVEGSVLVRLYRLDGEEPAIYETEAAEDGSFLMENVPLGEYRIEIAKDGHVTWETTVNIGEEGLTVTITLELIGDVTGDSKINIMDVVKLYAAVKGGQSGNENASAADVTGDGKVNIMDVVKLYAHVKGVSTLF